jgi:hypothetical protein
MLASGLLVSERKRERERERESGRKEVAQLGEGRLGVSARGNKTELL